MSLRPTFMGFETMRKAINAAQKALDVTGSNIGNVKTEGYSRQRVDLFSINAPSGGLRYRTSIGLAGQGVGISGIAQIRDPFLDKRYRELNSDSANAGTEFSVLTDIQDVLDQFTTDGFDTSFKALAAALSSYSANNADRGEIANITLQNASQMVQAIRGYNTKLAEIRGNTAEEMSSAANRISGIFKELGELNGQIVNGYLSSGDIIKEDDGYHANTKYGPNELKDQRNNLLDELSSYGNIRVHDNANGSITVDFAGQEVVNDQKAKSIELVQHSTGAMSYNIVGTGGTRTPITSTLEGLTGGALRGYLDIYNGAGSYSNDPAIRMGGVEKEIKEINVLLKSVSEAFRAGQDITVAQPGESTSLLQQLQKHGNFNLDGTGNLTLETEQMVSANGEDIQTLDVVASVNNQSLEIRVGGKALNIAGVRYDVGEINKLLEGVMKDNVDFPAVNTLLTEYETQMRIATDPALDPDDPTDAATIGTAKIAAKAALDQLQADYKADIRVDEAGNITHRGLSVYDGTTNTATPLVPPTTDSIMTKLQNYADFAIDAGGNITLDGQSVLNGAPPFVLNKLVVDDNMNITVNGATVDPGIGSITNKKAEGRLLQPTMGSFADALNESNTVMFNGTTNGLVYYQNVIDALANTLAGSFNNAASSEDFIDPDTGEFFIRAMFSPSDRGSKVTAGNLAITQEWLDDPAMIAKHIEWVDPADHTKGIQSKVTPLEELDNTFLQRLSAVTSRKLPFTIDSSRVGENERHVDTTCTIDKYVTFFSNKLSGDISFMEGIFKAADSMAGTVLDARDGVMAVDINEEGSNMMTFQKWFNASSRMLTTLDEALDTIISKMGLVGR